MGISPFQMESCQVLNLCSTYGASCVKLVHFYGYFKINLENFHSCRLKKIEIFFFIDAESMFVNLEVKSTLVKCWTLCSMYGAVVYGV
jgi:hypothetical protein